MIFTALCNALPLPHASLVLYPEYSVVAEDAVISFENWISFQEAILSAVATTARTLSKRDYAPRSFVWDTFNVWYINMRGLYFLQS